MMNESRKKRSTKRKMVWNWQKNRRYKGAGFGNYHYEEKEEDQRKI